jgi:hypothetical protein
MNEFLLCLLLTLLAAPLHAQTFDVLVWADEFSVDGPLDTAGKQKDQSAVKRYGWIGFHYAVGQDHR